MPSLRPEFVSLEAGAAETEMVEDGILAVFRLGAANFELQIISALFCQCPFGDVGSACAV